MIIYSYDSTFDGLLCTIFEASLRQLRPENIIRRLQEREQQNLFQTIHVDTRPKIAGAVYTLLKEQGGQEALTTAYYAFHGDFPQIDMAIFNYLEMVWKRGKEAQTLFSNESVLQTLDAQRKVSRERHMFCGILRFKDLGGIFYAPIAPEHYILPLLGNHFAHRMADQNWVIHDTGRGKALIYDQRCWYETDFHLQKSLNIPQSEKEYQKLWKTFFNSVTITSRRNKGLQKRNMPMKYWRYLTEMDDSISLTPPRFTDPKDNND